MIAANLVALPLLLLTLAFPVEGREDAAKRQRDAKMRLLDATNRLILQRPSGWSPPPWPGQWEWPHWTPDQHHQADHWDASQFADLEHLQHSYQPDPELLLEVQPEEPPSAFPGAHATSGVVGALPRPLGHSTGDQKLELSLGPCVLQLYEPCTDSGSIIFYLFSSVDGRPAVLSVTDPRLPADFDEDLPTKVLIHGFAGSVDFNFTSSVRQAYLLRGGYNVLVVDWGRLTHLPCYASSVVNTWQVARCTGQLLARLGQASPSLRPPHLHVVGFSLGAHIAAFVSDELVARTGQRVGRITGLDPALPAFASLAPSWKLDPGDADFVDVVHTNAGILGKVEPTGHADFYVNGGSVQPFCTGGDRNIPLCSHLLAPVYFSETILDESSHWGRYCSSYGHYAWGYCAAAERDAATDTLAGAFMGEGVHSSLRGTFIVETAASYPFALGPPQPISPPPRPQPPSVPQETFFVLLTRQKK
ncbi:pancreatic triacylglycerol lipase-like [Thrips palmi]|uniref:Pancreatic triacylglycerol lipase-like n=1 Tax=Thrips palmi TaxID=161013 RepID=A0A6P8Z8H0_THRPL|nr:pancreatic triacylglycerol lipase-like [Thrips palmi]